MLESHTINKCSVSRVIRKPRHTFERLSNGDVPNMFGAQPGRAKHLAPSHEVNISEFREARDRITGHKTGYVGRRET